MGIFFKCLPALPTGCVSVCVYLCMLDLHRRHCIWCPGSKCSLWPCPKAWYHPTLVQAAHGCLRRVPPESLCHLPPGQSAQQGGWKPALLAIPGYPMPGTFLSSIISLPSSCRATLQRVRTRPLLSGTMTRSCNACVSTWTMPCCTGECRLLLGLMEPGVGTQMPRSEAFPSLSASVLGCGWKESSWWPEAVLPRSSCCPGPTDCKTSPLATGCSWSISPAERPSSRSRCYSTWPPTWGAVSRTRGQLCSPCGELVAQVQPRSA